LQITVDLHSHSGYAGGVGDVPLDAIAKAMAFKGIDVYGCGDCIYPKRTEELKKIFQETSDGLFSFQDYKARFLLQTEIILTVSLPGYKNRVLAHHLVYFPDFESITGMQRLLEKWGQKNTIGRPFITSRNQEELEDRLFAIADLHPLIEIIPAHVMTPEGILGSRNRLESIKEFYGSFTPQIRVIETGLSADPQMLEQIPDLEKLTMISNSDTHSAALHRIGREFTILDTETVDYPGIIEALRKNKVSMTSEFFPAEGRFFLTGHRANREGHQTPIIYEGDAPTDLICPICNKSIFLGVRQRCLELSNPKIIPLKREFKHLLPLLEVIATAQKKGVISKTVWNEYMEVLKWFPSEIALWGSEVSDIEDNLDKRINRETLKTIIAVKEEHYRFKPAGYDGVYGVIEIALKN
jgi:PHP family Zn ribbon phosphoesterase